jgi:hypothetical protein
LDEKHSLKFLIKGGKLLMKFGVREICDVVLKAKANQKVGNKIFYKGEPVIYFDTLKTSSMEGAATTVYAQGGRGNSRLVAWEGERTVTFTMEDALISPAGFMILSGAGLIEASGNKPLVVHTTEQTAQTKAVGNKVTIDLAQEVSKDSNAGVYVMFLDDNGEIATEPFIPTKITSVNNTTGNTTKKHSQLEITLDAKLAGASRKTIDGNEKDYTPYSVGPDGSTVEDVFEGFKTAVANGDDVDKSNVREGFVVLVDYYVDKTSGVQQIDITPDKFGGNYYLEASTLFRTQQGVDMPAEFIIPNCKIQSNFTFTMASSGDPSSFTFTMDAFPDYTRFDKTKKVLAAIQIVDEGTGATELVRESTYAGFTH